MEHHRLLEEESPSSPATSDSPHVATADEPSRPTFTSHDQASPFSFSLRGLFLLRFCTEFSVASLHLPIVRLIEHAVCKRLSSVHASRLEEGECKSPSVQNKVATIIGYKLAFDALPCILTALFYGSLADSRGRKFVMVLSVTGQLLALLWIVFIGFSSSNIPIELIWLSSALLFLGGGIRLDLSMQYTSFCDAVSWKSRTTSLSYLHAAASVAAVIGFPVGSLLMEFRLWAPFSTAAAISLIKYGVLWYTPETSPILTGHRCSANPILLEPPRVFETGDSGSVDEPQSQPTPSSNSKPWHERLVSRTQSAYVWSFFWHRGLLVIFACYVTKRVAFASESFVSQYASELLHKTLLETFGIRYSNDISTLLVLGVLLPMFARRVASPGKESWVIRASLVLLCAGFWLFWLGRSLLVFCIGLAVCGLGEGLEIGLQSLGSHIVGDAKHATFFAFASILGVAGELIGGPLMAQIYRIRDATEKPLGFPFFLSIVLFGCLFIASFLLQTSKM